MAIDVSRKSKCALILSNGRLLYMPSKKYMLTFYMCSFNCRCGAYKSSVHRCVLLQSKNNSERQSKHAICPNLVRKRHILICLNCIQGDGQERSICPSQNSFVVLTTYRGACDLLTSKFGLTS